MEANKKTSSSNNETRYSMSTFIIYVYCTIFINTLKSAQALFNDYISVHDIISNFTVTRLFTCFYFRFRSKTFNKNRNKYCMYLLKTNFRSDVYLHVYNIMYNYK